MWRKECIEAGDEMEERIEKTLMVIKKFLKYFILEILCGINARDMMECYKTGQEGQLIDYCSPGEI